MHTGWLLSMLRAIPTMPATSVVVAPAQLGNQQMPVPRAVARAVNQYERRSFCASKPTTVAHSDNEKPKQEETCVHATVVARRQSAVSHVCGQQS